MEVGCCARFLDRSFDMPHRWHQPHRQPSSAVVDVCSVVYGAVAAVAVVDVVSHACVWLPQE